MAKRPRKDKGLVIFGVRMNSQAWVLFGLVAMFVFATLGYYVTGSGDTGQANQDFVQATVVFGTAGSVSRVITLEEGKSAIDLFREIASLSPDLSTVAVGNVSKTSNSTHSWKYYVNGALRLDGPSSHFPVSGDYIELRMSKRFY
ncbi:TPA: hypothetical protein H1008_00440 [archaeon]|nr:hypothetical protein [Candidatus Undinarchaeales archaeon SRR5007147.bin71]